MQKSRENLERLLRKLADVLEPPPDFTISEWADNERMLSSEASSESGKWDTSRAEYQREIMDAISDPLIERVVLMTSAQVGKTEIILNTLAYFITHDPAPILYVLPTLDMAQAISKDRIAPMVRDTPCLKGRIADSKAKNTGNTILHKSYSGGHLTLAGSNSPASLSSRPVRICLLDELDRMAVSSGSEGDPANLAIKRTNTFWNRKIVMVSTPTIKGISRIEQAYSDSTMEVYGLCCPSCGEYQQIRRKHIQHTYGSSKELIKVEAYCDHCGVISSENEWKRKHGKWLAQRSHANTRGFHLNEYVSPWKTWLQIELDFLEAKKNPETLKTFVNTSLGETWEEQGESVEATGLIARLETYTFPEAIRATTCGVDIQKDRIELEYVGWAKDRESYALNYIVLAGDTARSDVWQDLQDVLNQLQPDITCIDAGFNTTFVYDFCKKQLKLRVIPVKGQSGAGYAIIEDRKKRLQRLRGQRKTGIKPELIGTDQAKSMIYSMLKVDTIGANYCHFRNNGEFDPEYFDQLTGEKLITKILNGRPILAWKQTRPRVEALDCRVYNLAGLEILLQTDPNIFERNRNIIKEAKEVAQETYTERTVTTHRNNIRRSRSRNNFVHGWK